MAEYQQFPVTGAGGLRGTMFATSRFLDERPQRLLRLADGREFVVPAKALQARDDGSYFLNMPPGELERYAASAPSAAGGAAPQLERSVPVQPQAPAGDTGTDTVIPVVQEELEVGRRTVETGRVRIHKTVSETERVVDEPLLRDEYEVTRVPVNRVVDAPVETRREGDTTIVPLYEEVLVVEKRLMLREELRITRKRREFRDPRHVSLRKETAEVERVDPEK